MSFLDDVKKDAASMAPSDEQLRLISNLATQQLELEDEVAELEKRLKDKKEELRGVSEVKIPEAMAAVGLKEFKLDSGFKVSVKPYYSGSIGGENAGQAYSWLEDHGYADLIKAELHIKHRRSQDVRALKVLAEQLGFDYSDKFGVHHMTMSAWIKEMITEGKSFPRDLFNVFTGFKTKIGR